nr:uncharacterized protein LOC102444823 [Pelodiscus sinensis]|eukprot:XP_006119391.2 uncharacterized protein LOC102444823 [Pelodiscus sinensis]
MGPFPALLFLLALTGPCMAGKDPDMVRRVQGDTFITGCQYDKTKYSQTEKFWCKALSDLECNILARSSPGRNYQNTPPKAKISLKDSGTGWISVSMTELRIEDSGIYWCGVSDNLKIIPLIKIKLAVSYEAPVRLSAKKGNSISLTCSYFVMDDSKQPKNFTWCKMVTAIKCQPVISVEFHQIVNTQGRTRIQIDLRKREITVTLVELQLRDSGEYQCEANLPGSTELLKMIGLNVLESYYGTDVVATSHLTDDKGATLPTAARNDEQSWNPEARVNALYIMVAWLGTKFIAALLIFTIACRRSSRAMGQVTHGRNKHQLLPLTESKKGQESSSKTKMW